MEIKVEADDSDKTPPEYWTVMNRLPTPIPRNLEFGRGVTRRPYLKGGLFVGHCAVDIVVVAAHLFTLRLIRDIEKSREA